MLSLRRSRWAWLVLGLLIGSMALAACGSDSGSSASGDEGQTSAEETQSEGASGDSAKSEGLKKAEERVAAWEEGQFSSPPTEGPPAAENKDVWILTYGLAATPGVDFTEGAEGAAKILGWKTHRCDGKFSTSQWQQCIRQAVAAGADAVALYTVDCASTEAAMREAKEAGLLLVSSESLDCDQQQEGAEALMDYQVEFDQGDLVQWLGDLNRSGIDKITEESGGQAKIILVNETGNAAVAIMTEAAKEELAEVCPECEIAEQVDYNGEEYGSQLQAKVGQAMLANPDADYILSPYDDATLGGVIQAVRESGRQGEVKVYSGVGIEPGLELVRNGEVVGEYVQDLRWEGWAVMDALNRLFNGEKASEIPPSGQGIGYLTPETVAATGRYKPPIEYQKIYEEMLGGK